MKSGLQDNGIEMYSTHSKGKSVVAERFIRTLKNKIYKYVTSVSKNMYIDKVANIVTKFVNNVCWIIRHLHKQKFWQVITL